MAATAERLFAGHRSRRETRRHRRRRKETQAAYATRLRGLQRHHETAAAHAPSGDERRRHEEAAASLEAPAGEADYRAAKDAIGQSETAGGWQSALFLLVGSGLTLWLLLSGHIKGVGQALGWTPANRTKTHKPAKPARKAAGR